MKRALDIAFSHTVVRIPGFSQGTISNQLNDGVEFRVHFLDAIQKTPDDFLGRQTPVSDHFRNRRGGSVYNFFHRHPFFINDFFSGTIENSVISNPLSSAAIESQLENNAA